MLLLVTMIIPTLFPSAMFMTGKISISTVQKVVISWMQFSEQAAIEKLALKYAPDDTMENLQAAIKKEWTPLCTLEMIPEHISGKEAIELKKNRNKQAGIK